MNLEDYRTIFAGTALIVMLVAASPALSVAIPLRVQGQRFSELWVLGPNHMAEDFPFNTAVGEKEQVFIGIGNHMGHLSYYVVYVKLRNQTQPAPDSTISTPSPLAPLYEFRVLIEEGMTWEASVVFSFLEASSSQDLFVVTKISINDAVSTGVYPSAWNSASRGFYYQLLFELWIYDDAGSSFEYDNRFVGIWLNMTN